VSDILNHTGAKKGDLQEVINAVGTSSIWADIMHLAATNVKSIINKNQINKVDRQNLVVQTDLIARGFGINNDAIDVFKRAGATTLFIIWSRAWSVWKSINKKSPENDKDKVAFLVSDFEALVPKIDHLHASLRTERDKKAKTKADFIDARANAIAELPILITALEGALPILVHDKASAVSTIYDIMKRIDPLQPIFLMSKDNLDNEVGYLLMTLLRVCDSKKEWQLNTTVGCKNCIFEIKHRLPQLPQVAEYRE
jgi:hypothetical protein